MTTLSVDPHRCAVLLLDFTTGIVDTYATNGRTAAANAATLAAAVRGTGTQIVHVLPAHFGLDGAPVLRAGSLIDELSPQQGDKVIYKSRIGAFSTTALDVELRLANRDTLIIAGIATSGTVLSTSRQAYDLGYRVVVVEDACSDPEDTVHEILTQPVHKDSWIGLWRIADICKTDELIAVLQSPAAD